MRQSELDGYQYGGECPWHDEELLRELYHDEKYSTQTIADLFGCSKPTVLHAMDGFGIERRSLSEAMTLAQQTDHVKFRTDNNGYERLVTSQDGEPIYARHHRLLAVAEYGFDAVSDILVHHGVESHLPAAEIPWANWPGNIELVSAGDHIRHHKSIPKERLIEDLRELGDELGKEPAVSDMNEKGPYNVGTYQNHFGSWSEAKKIAFGEGL